MQRATLRCNLSMEHILRMFRLGLCPYDPWSHHIGGGSMHLLHINDSYDSWSQHGLGGSMVKKFHTPVGRRLNGEEFSYPYGSTIKCNEQL